MTPLQFLRSREVAELFERAHGSTGIPVSTHFVSDGREGPKLAGCGACAMCAYVAELPGGKRACLNSRLSASLEAQHTGRPTAFLCHMKFMCVSIPVLAGAQEGFVTTLGPYCPAEAREGLALEAQRGFEAIEGEFDASTARALDELTIVRAAAPPSLAQWLRDELATRWSAIERAAETDNIDQTHDSARSTHGADRLPKLDPFGARTIALALAAGDNAQVRAKTEQVLNEGNADVFGLHVRSLALGFAVLDAAARRERQVRACWERKESFFQDMREAETAPVFVNALVRLWRPLVGRSMGKRKPKPEMPRLEIAGLNDIVSKQLANGLSLNGVASVLGVHPTTITHRLQRNFGVSFSQYVARMRLDKAKELLRRTRLSVRDIAVRVGIDDASNFTKLFKRFEHMSPIEYREKQKGRR